MEVESRKSPTAELFDVDSGRISIHHWFIELKVCLRTINHGINVLLGALRSRMVFGFTFKGDTGSLLLIVNLLCKYHVDKYVIDRIVITLKDPDHPFVEPPPHDDIVSFIKKLGYPGSLDQISKMYVTKLNAVLGNLKFTNKGEKEPIYRMAILKEMMSDEIKASADYSKYLTKSIGTRPVKETVIEENEQSKEVADTMDLKENNEDECRLNERQSGLVLGREVTKESDEGTLDHSNKFFRFLRFLHLLVRSLLQAMDEQDRIKQVGKGQAKVSVLEPQVETHVVQLLSSSLTLSSAKYVNQFINDNPDVSLTDVLKEPVEAEVQSMVDVPNHQENPPEKHHDDNQDPPTDSKKEKKKRRRKDTEPSKKYKDTTVSSKKGKDPSKSSKPHKTINAEESVQDAAMDEEELVHDDDIPETLDPDWFKEPNVNDAPKQPWFNELVDAEKDPKDFDDLVGSTIDFTKFAKDYLKKDKITKANLEGPAYALLKGNYKNNIKLEYNMEQCYLALTD
uniref:Uncharacterized protein n=1 Tax=Tanacetum cinerariifolium TaxID=118510 RepID=A0A6L2NQX0_TANCI|nr:hypothetical protein [Tanacetum cinerariifolium]